MQDDCIWRQRWRALSNHLDVTIAYCANDTCARVDRLTHCAGCDTHWCDEHFTLHTGCSVRNGHLGRYALPNDVFLLILSHLYGPDLARWRRTCKYFYALIQGERALWERVCLHVYCGAHMCDALGFVARPRQRALQPETFLKAMWKRVYQARQINLQPTLRDFIPIDTFSEFFRVFRVDNRLYLHFHVLDCLVCEVTRPFVFFAAYFPDVFRLHTFENTQHTCVAGHHHRNECSAAGCTMFNRGRFSVFFSFEMPTVGMSIRYSAPRNDEALIVAWNAFSPAYSVEF